jgi:PAS domain S-box-containing protein
MRLYASRTGRSRHVRAGTAVLAAQTPGELPAAAAATDQAAASALARDKPRSPLAGYGPIDLWRAALDAMPATAACDRRVPDRTNLQTVLLDQIHASVVVTDMSGVVISWNRGAEALYGWSGAEAIGHSATELMVPEDTHEAERLFVELHRDGRWDGELNVRRKDGTPFTAYVRNRMTLDEEGNPAAIVGVAVDITARVAAETELVQSRDYAQAVTECMGEGLFTLDVDGLSPTSTGPPRRCSAGRAKSSTARFSAL